jgi:hypothetical protein
MFVGRRLPDSFAVLRITVHYVGFSCPCMPDSTVNVSLDQIFGFLVKWSWHDTMSMFKTLLPVCANYVAFSPLLLQNDDESQSRELSSTAVA